jgi:protein O-mannosyl-transferase
MTQKDRGRALIVCLVLGLGTIALYYPAFGFSFVNMSDEVYVLGNPHVNKGLSGAFGWAIGTGYGDVWQPMTWLSHALDCQIYGLKPGGHHATNLILHALNSVLVFLVLRQLTGAFWRSAAVAAFFAWHPLHVEVFAWVAERKNLLCAFFWLLALWAYACYAEKAKARLSSAKFYYIGAVVLFAFAVMSNISAVVFPFILLLLDWWPLGRYAATEERSSVQQTLFLWAEKIPLFILAITAIVVTMKATAGAHPAELMARLPFRIRFATAGMSCFRYLAKSFWPGDLGLNYPFVLHWAKWQLISAALVLLGITIVAFRTRKTRPFWLTGWFWFLIALFPVLNLVQADAPPMADRYMYIPSIGLWMLFCWEAYDLLVAWPSGRMILSGLCVLLLAACCVGSELQLGSWRNEGTLSARIPDAKVNAVGHVEYANYLVHHNQLTQAQAEIEKAIAIAPDRPAYAVLLGEIFLAGRKADQAIQNFQTALRLDRTMDVARLELGQAYLIKGDMTDAGEEFKVMLQRDPKSYVAYYWLGQTFVLQGNTGQAIAAYKQSLACRPNQPVVLNDLAWLLATDSRSEIRHGKEAVELADRAAALTRGQEPVILGTLAAAYAESGDFNKAVLAGQKAYDLAVAQGQKSLAETNLQLVALYRDHKPFHQPQKH